MALEEYPDILLRDVDSLVTFLERIVETRNDDVAQLNVLLELSSYNSGFARLTSIFTANETIGRTNLYSDVDATSGNLTIKLDPTPIDGQTNYIAKSDSGSNTVTVDGNGKNINGTSSLVLTSQYDKLMVVYMGGSDEWRKWI